MDMFQLVLLNNAIFAIILFVFLRVLIGKLPQITEFLRETIKNDLETWLNSETGQKALYSIGGLIGHGAVAGSRIQKTGGKFKWENLLGDIVSQYIQTKIPLIPKVNPNQNPDLPVTQIEKVALSSA